MPGEFFFGTHLNTGIETDRNQARSVLGEPERQWQLSSSVVEYVLRVIREGEIEGAPGSGACEVSSVVFVSILQERFGALVGCGCFVCYVVDGPKKAITFEALAFRKRIATGVAAQAIAHSEEQVDVHCLRNVAHLIGCVEAEQLCIECLLIGRIIVSRKDG
jgi:hypothetical protein